MSPTRLLCAALLVLIAACAAEQHENIIGQPELTQQELDAVTARSDGADAGAPGLNPDQTELDVAEAPPPPAQRARRPRKMDAPSPQTRGKKLTPAPSASPKP